MTRRSPPVDKEVANFDKLPRKFGSLTLVSYQIDGICTDALVQFLIKSSITGFLFYL